MADSARDFPTLETESGITASEREEIRAHIERVTTENRIPVEAADFSLGSARRGVLLPTIVNVAAVVAIGVAGLVLGLVFRQGERRLETQAAQYASVEGKLIRELRAESQQMMSNKQKEIEEVRQKLRDLEQQQKDLEGTFATRLAQKEEEFREQLKKEVEAERTRLLTQGLGQAEMERLLRKYEAERKAYYDQQLVAFRKSLEAERAQLQADITRLRSEYTTRLSRLEQEQRQIVSDYEKRETNLRLQLEQKTMVMDRLRTQNTSDLEAAQRELGRLTQEHAQTVSIENQIDGMANRIMEATMAGDTATALARVRELQGFLHQDRVRSVASMSSRLRTEIFLLNQLQAELEERLQLQSSSASHTLTEELALLGQIRMLSQDASASRDDNAKLDLYRKIAASMPELRVASDAIAQDAARQAVEKEREAFRVELETALAAQAASLAPGQTPGGAGGQGAQAGAAAGGDTAVLARQIEELTQKLSQQEARDKEESGKRLDALASRARTTRDNLDRRIDALNSAEDQMNAAKTAFASYVKQDKEARSANPSDPMTASRQELNKFLRDEAVRRIFLDIADRVNALYAATQTAGSSAALANAAEILTDVAKQPTLKASRQLLQHEITNGGLDAQLKAILTSLDGMLARAQASETQQ